MCLIYDFIDIFISFVSYLNVILTYLMYIITYDYIKQCYTFLKLYQM